MIKWLYEHYFLTTILCVYYLALIGFGTYKVFVDITEITSSVVGAYGTLMALPAIVTGLMKWRASKEEE